MHIMYTLMIVFYCFVFTFLLNSLKFNLKQGGGLDITIRALLLEMSNLRKLPNLQGSIDDAKVLIALTQREVFGRFVVKLKV